MYTWFNVQAEKYEATIGLCALLGILHYTGNQTTFPNQKGH